MTYHPDAIFIQLTTGCNAKCTSCPHPFTYGAEGSHQTGNMSARLWAELVRQIGAADYRGQVGLYLHHEPLLCKTLGRKIRDVNEATNAYVVLSTNGALLTAERRRELRDARPRTVHVNISSADPDQYEGIMALTWETTRANVHAFIAEAADVIDIEINCPVLPEVDTDLLRREFPGVKVNVEAWANSRGGLLDDVDASGKGSRFKGGGTCRQPTQNLNVLWDGSVILCCMDWAHETKAEFPPITEENLFATYRGRLMEAVRAEFQRGDYTRYAMCDRCANEMGFKRCAS